MCIVNGAGWEGDVKERRGPVLKERFCFMVAQCAQHMQFTVLAICKCQFSGRKFIPSAVQPVSLSVSRTFSSSGSIGLSWGTIHCQAERVSRCY